MENFYKYIRLIFKEFIRNSIYDLLIPIAYKPVLLSQCSSITTMKDYKRGHDMHGIDIPIATTLNGLHTKEMKTK